MHDTTEQLEMWILLGNLWASGQYSTLAALHRQSVKLYGGSAPTVIQIRRRADREMWTNEGEISESMQRESQRTAADILNELGLSLVRRVELIAEMVESPHRDYDRLREIIDAVIVQIKEAGGVPDAKTMQGVYRDLGNLYQKGCRLSLDALKLAGEYAGDIGRSSADADGKPLDDKTPEEIKIETERILGSMMHNFIEREQAKKNSASSET